MRLEIFCNSAEYNERMVSSIDGPALLISLIISPRRAYIGQKMARTTSFFKRKKVSDSEPEKVVAFVKSILFPLFSLTHTDTHTHTETQTLSSKQVQFRIQTRHKGNYPKNQ